VCVFVVGATTIKAKALVLRGRSSVRPLFFVLKGRSDIRKIAGTVSLRDDGGATLAIVEVWADRQVRPTI